MVSEIQTPDEFKASHSTTHADVARALGVSAQNYGNMRKRYGENIKLYLSGDSLVLVKSDILKTGTFKPASKTQS